MKSYEVNIKKIINTLLNNPQFLTLSMIADNVGLSKRSVQNYLGDIDSWIRQNGLDNTRIERKPGQGIMLVTESVDKRRIEKLLRIKSLSVNSDDNKRRLDIIKKLIILKEKLTVRFLAEQFYVNRAVILSDLEWVKQWLASYKLELDIPLRKSFEIKGDEVAHRNAIAGYFDSYWSIDSEEPIILKRRDFLNEKIVLNLTAIYPEDTVQKVKSTIEKAEKEFNFILTADYYTSLLTHIVISVTRLLSGNTVAPEFIPPEDEEFPEEEMETVEYIAQQLEEAFTIKVSSVEKQYICIHLVGFNALSSERSANAEIPEKVKKLALELIKYVDNHMGTNFISDEILFFDLCLHLKSKVYRLQKDVYCKEVAKFQLNGNDYMLYHAVANASHLYYEICEVTPDEEELLNITCYLLLSLRRNIHKSKALLICNDGITLRMELLDYMTKCLPTVEITDCCTVHQLKLLTISDYDFIISTEKIQSLERPVVELSDMAREEYADCVNGFLTKMAL